MADDVSNLVLEWMRRLDRKVDEVKDEMRHMGQRLGSVERILSGQYVSEVDQNSEIDRLKARVERIEKRLELTES